MDRLVSVKLTLFARGDRKVLKEEYKIGIIYMIVDAAYDDQR